METIDVALLKDNGDTGLEGDTPDFGEPGRG
jgi:hypothetical protein